MSGIGMPLSSVCESVAQECLYAFGVDESTAHAFCMETLPKMFAGGGTLTSLSTIGNGGEASYSFDRRTQTIFRQNSSSFKNASTRAGQDFSNMLCRNNNDNDGLGGPEPVYEYNPETIIDGLRELGASNDPALEFSTPSLIVDSPFPRPRPDPNPCVLCRSTLEDALALDRGRHSQSYIIPTMSEQNLIISTLIAATAIVLGSVIGKLVPPNTFLPNPSTASVIGGSIVYGVEGNNSL